MKYLNQCIGPVRLSSQGGQKIKPELKEAMQHSFVYISVATIKGGDRWTKKDHRGLIL